MDLISGCVPMKLTRSGMRQAIPTRDKRFADAKGSRLPGFENNESRNLTELQTGPVVLLC